MCPCAVQSFQNISWKRLQTWENTYRRVSTVSTYHCTRSYHKGHGSLFAENSVQSKCHIAMCLWKVVLLAINLKAARILPSPKIQAYEGLKGLHWSTGNLHIRAKEGPNSRLNDVVGPTFQDKSCQSLLTRWPGGLAAYSPHKPHPSPAGNELHVNVRKSHLLDVTVSWLHAPADMFKWFWYRPTKPIGRYVKYGINHMRIHCPKMPCNCLLPDGNNQHRKNGLRERESIHRPASTPHARVLDFNACLLILLLTAAQLQLWFSNMDGRQGPSSQGKYILHAILTWAVCLS